MDVYMSFWSTGNSVAKLAVTMTKKSVELASRYYDGVHLITDVQGAETFKDISWLSVSTELESLPKKYKDVWSLGKLKAYNIIAAKRKPFIHIDYDFFLLNRIPKHIESSDVFFQSKENLKHFRAYCLDSIYRECHSFPFKEDQYLDLAFNCGVVGGNNYDFFNQYTNLSLDCVLDVNNREFWLGDGKLFRKQYGCFRPASKALLAEQYIAAHTCKKLNITPSFLIDGPYYTDRNTNDIFIHLYGHFKTREAYEARVKNL